MGDSFFVSTDELSKGSQVRVNVKCDYCGNIYSVVWGSYLSLKHKTNNKDCCNNPDCTHKKSKETLIHKYGVDNARLIEGTSDKIKQACLKKYGVDNPFKSCCVKEKIKASLIDKYGVDSPMRSEYILNKAEQTCLEKYGETRFSKTEEFRERNKGENNGNWKGGVSPLASNKEKSIRERTTYEYRSWRNSVFSRDKYTCQRCLSKSQKGNRVELHAHHILNWKDNISARLDVENGITLCDKCHYEFHSMFGKENNSLDQINIFIQTKKYADLSGNTTERNVG